DREEFLRAFEKPTQIYRFLRARHCISPVFLHRSLFYMQDRCSRNNGRRKLFRVDDLFAACKAKQTTVLPPQYNQLKIVITAFCIDPGVANENSLQKKFSDVEAEVCVRKSLRCRRKDNESVQTEEAIGSVDVPVNPKARHPHDSDGIVLDTDDMQRSSDGQQVKTYTLIFRVFETQDVESETEPESSDDEMSDNDSFEFFPQISRAANDKTAIYEAELAIYSADKETLLVDGDYELSMIRKSADTHDYKRNATWEALDGGRNIEALSAMNNCPLLKFSLKWSEEGLNGPLAGFDSEKFITGEPEAKRMRRRNAKNTEEEGSSWFQSTVSKHVVFYQFIYNSETQQQTEARDDLYCPWCQLNCITLYGLVKHLKMCHPRFNFTYVAQENGSSIEVSVNECYDGSYCGNPQFIFAQPGMAFSRRGPVRRIQVTDTLVYRPKRHRHNTNMDLNELLGKRRERGLSGRPLRCSPLYILFQVPLWIYASTGHHRLYFHSETVVPVRPCEFDMDSEEETDPEWLRAHTTKMLDEFTDVNDGEKPIMKLWNLYVMKHNCIADAQLATTCREFLDVHAALIVKHNLRRNLLLHFVTLVDFGVLKASVL
uniref:Uncharacterized protein n=1 Tax=Ciona savignyi TaxID=51511 RepID=H2YZ91_CIOSA